MSTTAVLLLAALLHCITAAPSQDIISGGVCPDGSTPRNIYCYVNPCMFATCPAVEGATCVADYCGGCNDRWILGVEEVTPQCKGSCPDGTNPGNCLVNPCQRATCPGVKGARCVADYCGGCNTLWVLNGEAVSHLCGVKRCIIPGQVYTDCGSACPPTCDDPEPFCTVQCVEGCQCPRGTVLDGNRCIPHEKCPPVFRLPAVPIQIECDIPGQVYTECGSACTATCEVPNPLCTLDCVPRCECPTGTLLHEKRCIPSNECFAF